MIQAMFSAVSGIQAHQTRLDTVGNNIANVNTAGFKSSRVSFVDQLSSTLRGATKPGVSGGTNPLQSGLGVKVGAITLNQAQGSLQQTGRASDMALQGNGFFQVGNGSQAFYSRDGSFALDSQGNLVHSATGFQLLGWQAVNGVTNTSGPVGPASTMKIPVGSMTITRATKNVEFGGNLDASAKTGTQYARTARIFDSLGNAHDLKFNFTKTATPNQWSYAVTSPTGTVTTGGTGTMTFNVNGQLTSTPPAIGITLANGAATPLSITPNMAKVTQLAGEFNANPISQDGSPLGVLQSYSIGEDGTINGAFSNGLTQELGRIAIAQFTNPSGLEKVGGNMFRTSPNSGDALINPPGVSGAGTVASGFLEQSNVNLADEFTSMIVTQRGFQANTRIVTASDEILQDLLQMKR